MPHNIVLDGKEYFGEYQLSIKLEIVPAMDIWAVFYRATESIARQHVTGLLNNKQNIINRIIHFLQYINI